MTSLGIGLSCYYYKLYKCFNFITILQMLWLIKKYGQGKLFILYEYLIFFILWVDELNGVLSTFEFILYQDLLLMDFIF